MAASAAPLELSGVLLVRPAYARRAMTDASTPSRTETSEALLEGLRSGGAAAEDAVAALHALLLRGAHHELGRRREQLAGVPRAEVEDLATQAADDAVAAILTKLHTFRGDSRFTTWAYKFVLLEAGVKARRRAWQDREVVLDDASWRRLATATPSAQQSAEEAELLRAIAAAMETALSPRQREVLTALVLDGVPIDVLAERLGSPRGALYKSLHDARRKLRTALAEAGHDLGDRRGGDA